MLPLAIIRLSGLPKATTSHETSAASKLLSRIASRISACNAGVISSSASRKNTYSPRARSSKRFRWTAKPCQSVLTITSAPSSSAISRVRSRLPLSRTITWSAKVALRRQFAIRFSSFKVKIPIVREPAREGGEVCCIFRMLRPDSYRAEGHRGRLSHTCDCPRQVHASVMSDTVIVLCFSFGLSKWQVEWPSIVRNCLHRFRISNE